MVQRGDGLIPFLAQELALDKAPLVPWLAAAGLSLLRPALDAPDAARVAVGVLLTLLLAFTGFAARELNGRALRWLPVLLLVGSVGLFDRSHQLSEELGLAVCVALAVYAIALALRRPYVGGLLLGLAIGFGFLSVGWLGPMWTLVPALLLVASGEAWRSRAYAATLAIAVAVAIPLVAAWPLALYARSPELFDAWRQAQPLTDVLPDWAHAEPAWLAKNIVWVAWPAVPLLLWTLWIRGRGFNGGMRPPGVVVPGVFAAWMLVSLALLPDPRLMQMVPMLAPLALVASLEVDSMKREHSAALDWFGILTFGLAAIALWGFWVDAYVNGMSPRVAILLRDSETGYATSLKLRVVLAAVFLTALWIVLVRPARRSNRRALLNWTAGMTLIWGLLATIWLPYLDARRTYEPIGESLRLNRPENACMARRGVGEAQRALFYYFGGVVTVPEEAAGAERCPMLLVQYGRLPDGTPQLPGHVVQWEGSRRGDGSERFVLYRRTAS
jgi:4-amino-4-deoxy-L-arabinose transferase-like glycosyltransferase